MPHHNRCQILYFCCIVAFAGCAANSQAPPNSPPPSPNTGGAIAERNEGYSLLYGLMKDESDVGKIFVIKSADDSVKKSVKDVGDACQGVKKQLEEFKSADVHLVLDTPALPALETESRDLARKEKTKSLLFSSGQTFELRLVFSQAQAMGYAQDLAEALVKREDNPQRKVALSKWSQQFSGLSDEMMNLLSVK
jgi:hypothetical protein